MRLLSGPAGVVERRPLLRTQVAELRREHGRLVDESIDPPLLPGEDYGEAERGDEHDQNEEQYENGRRIVHVEPACHDVENAAFQRNPEERYCGEDPENRLFLHQSSTSHELEDDEQEDNACGDGEDLNLVSHQAA
jgi:hypothetical protein